jgi:hypothetical protein
MHARRKAALWWRGRRAVLLWTIGLLVPGVALMMFVPVTWSAYRLHDGATASTSRVDVQQVHHCLRSCWYKTRVRVQFPDAQGLTEEAVLKGVAQDPSFYRSGIRVVYDAKNPEVAMAVRDYTDGRGVWPKVAIPLALLLVFGELLLAIRFLRRPRATKRT